ncbi:agmatine deiminase family protein [Algoriphagus persicinus]|uniref:agmatine deiminase family protein n=1 Tax=Algoriphagus persicinus TaxID=3108754 RepID=UPI002B36B827|nr:agmatine deiminase family protein [Algoriphagus sp. E1-3-M2]MEB2785216.1 agmatine deiminase family protein [Algoriphagus sp. E1-3-M2]
MTDIFALAKSGEKTPAELGYYFPAEFAPHTSTWLSWPHKEGSWPGKLETIFAPYSEFIKYVALGEIVNINVSDKEMKAFALAHLEKAGVNLANIRFHFFPTNDAWCRDHGPAFLINPNAEVKKVLVKWNYNAWGEKYPPHDLDNQIPIKIAEELRIPCFNPEMVMEGGSVEFNGKGTLLTSEACLLNENRNPHLKQDKIERYLQDYYGVNHILWVGDGIVGDDTDGHIDDITRFVNADTVVTVVEENSVDENYQLLQENLKRLHKMRLENGKQLNVVELPMPSPVIWDDQRLPASYANFYIANHAVVVPTFRDKKDQQALAIISDCFPDRKVVGVDSTDIIWGLGSFHCLSQQEPAV